MPLNQSDEPAGLDDFLGEQDPQGAIAAQGFQAPVQALGQHLQDQFNQGGQNIHQALGPVDSPNAKDALMRLGANAAMSTVGKVEGAIPGLESDLGHVTTAGYSSKVDNALALLKSAEDAFAAGSVDQTAVQFATQKLKSAQRIANRNKFADGGEVDPSQAPTTNEPPGLDNFLQSQAEAPEPAGLDDYLKQAQYGSPLEMAKTGAEGAAKGLFGPLATLAETKLLGVNPEDIRGRREANPITAGASEIGGLAAPLIATGGASSLAKLTVSGALEAVGKKLGLEGAETLAGRIGQGAAKAAIDNMLVQGGDETSKMITQDPNQTAQTAIANIGLAGSVGALLGSTGSAAASLWSSKSERGVGALINDFKARVQQHIDNPDMASSIQTELDHYYTGIKGVADDVYGPQGLKAQDIEKAMPEMSDKITDQLQGVAEKLQSTIAKMQKDPYTYPPRLTNMLSQDFENFASKASIDNAEPKDIFNATQDLKQTLQGYSKFDRQIAPFAEESGFVKIAKGLQNDLRTTLEDSDVWGDAAKRQLSINKAFTDYLPSLKDFEKKFTVEVGGDKVLDPAKIQTYVNQLDKPNAEIKKDILRNFIDASDKYKSVIDQSHANLGLESPVVDSTLNVTKSSLGDKTAGAKLADLFIHQGLVDGGSKLAGGVIGGLAGHRFAETAIGALLGTHVVSPFLKSILPAIAKTMVRGSDGGTAAGLKAAVDTGVAAYNTNKLMDRTISAIFKGGSEVLPRMLTTTDPGKLYKLSKMVDNFNANPSSFVGADNKVNQFMPGVGDGQSASIGQALNYLASIRPNTSKQAPLDAKVQVSSTDKANYNNALKIAQQPLSVFDKMNSGTLTAKDMMHLSSMYPDLAVRMQQKVLNQIITQQNKGIAIPYRVKMGASIMLNQPLDSSMTAGSINAAQVQPGYIQQQQAQGPAPRGGNKSSPSLQKGYQSYLTPTQARLMHSQTK